MPTLMLTRSMLRVTGWLMSMGVAAMAVAQGQPPKTVVFVCEHGSVKSLIAREWFNRRAHERGLDIRATSRGLSPDAAVPEAIAAALRADGFDVRGFKPQALDEADVASAARVVGIGVDLATTPARGRARLETWDGIPPASERYAASRDALRARIEALLDTLEATPPRR